MNLSKILKDHQLWIDSKSMKGKKAALQRLDLCGEDLSGLDLRQVDFYYSNLKGINFSGSNLSGASFYGANLPYANLEKIIAEDTEFTYCTMIKVNLNNANLKRAHFESTFLESSLFKNAEMEYTVLDGANLYQCNLENANLQFANMVEGDLTEADLSGANLFGINLYRTKRKDAIFPLKKVDPGSLYKIKNKFLNSTVEGQEAIFCLLKINSDQSLDIAKVLSGEVFKRVPFWVKYSMEEVQT